MTKLYQVLALRVEAMKNCEATGNTEWRAKHLASIEWLVKQFMPFGGGFDNGTVFIWSGAANLLAFDTRFHHMNGDGYYNGWTSHTVRVRPSLALGFLLTISGQDRNNVKDVVHEAFYDALNIEIDKEMEDRSYDIQP